MMMNNQNAGAGGNSKMMNFGNSRAKMSIDSRESPAHRLIAALAELLPLQDIVVEEQSVDEMVASMYQSLDLS